MKDLIKYLIIFFLFFSCQNKWKKPVNLTFYYSLNKTINFLSVKSCIVNVSSIDISGDRIQAKDIDMEKDFEIINKIDFLNGNSNEKMEYNIPQGTYNPLKIELSTGIDNENITVKIKNIFYGQNDTLPVIFKSNSNFNIDIIAKNSENKNEIDLITGKNYLANLVFDFDYLFQVISISMLDNANKSIDFEDNEFYGEEVINVDDNNNTDIYSLLINRLNDSMKITIKEN